VCVCVCVFVSLLTHQRLGHDDAYLALGGGGEVGEEALEDELARLAVGVDADGRHGGRSLLARRTADRRDGGLGVSVAHGRRWREDQNKRRQLNTNFSFTGLPLRTPTSLRPRDSRR